MNAKRLLVCILLIAGQNVNAQNIQLVLKPATNSPTISRDIYGHFAEHLGRCIYDGFYRNGAIRTDVVAALKRIKVPNLRWPGGCFADQYHWKDGIGPVSERPATLNVTWGMVKEDNSFGTHEFLEVCRLIGCEPYVAGNVGTGSPQEMKEWVEYLNLKEGTAIAEMRGKNGHPEPYQVKLWGVGNESWGCGGNMQPEFYADQYKQFASFLPDYSGTTLKKVISGANSDDYHWTEVMMKKIRPGEAWGLSVHYYTVPTGNWNAKGSATNFSEQEYAHTLKAALKMETLVSENEKIMDRYDPKKAIALVVDEWGVWNDVEPGTPGYALYQQNSLRDALVAASTLNIFNNHAERVRGANLAQAVNVLQSLILTKDDKMILTPTFHVFDLFKVHQDAKLIPLEFQSPIYIKGADTINSVNASASQDSSGTIHISLVNLDPTKTLKINISTGVRNATAQIISAEKITDINTFEKPDQVVIKPFTRLSKTKDRLEVSLPPKSIVMITGK